MRDLNLFLADNQRLFHSPIPPTMSRHLTRCLLLWLASLPLVLSQRLPPAGVAMATMVTTCAPHLATQAHSLYIAFAQPLHSLCIAFAPPPSAIYPRLHIPAHSNPWQRREESTTAEELSVPLAVANTCKMTCRGWAACLLTTARLSNGGLAGVRHGGLCNPSHVLDSRLALGSWARAARPTAALPSIPCGAAEPCALVLCSFTCLPRRYIFCGMEEIGAQVEQPFETMPLWQLCHLIAHEAEAAIAGDAPGQAGEGIF